MIEKLLPPLKFTDDIDTSSMEEQTVLRIDDIKHREYMWDGTELYRLIPLKGKARRKL